MSISTTIRHITWNKWRTKCINLLFAIFNSTPWVYCVITKLTILMYEKVQWLWITPAVLQSLQDMNQTRTWVINIALFVFIILDNTSGSAGNFQQAFKISVTVTKWHAAGLTTMRCNHSVLMTEEESEEKQWHEIELSSNACSPKNLNWPFVHRDNFCHDQLDTTWQISTRLYGIC